MPKRPETESEKAFAEFLTERGYESEYEPAVVGKTKNIDFRVHLNGAPLFFEVKEFAAKEIKQVRAVHSVRISQSMQRSKGPLSSLRSIASFLARSCFMRRMHPLSL